MTEESLNPMLPILILVGIIAFTYIAVGPAVGVQFEQTTEADIIEIESGSITKAPATDGRAQLDLHVSVIESADSLVWISPEGNQVAASRFPYGGGEVDLLGFADLSDVSGENQLVAVRGGTIDCYGDVCEQTGGERVTSITFNVTG